MRLLAASLALALLVLAGRPAAGEDGAPFHRTTPRGALAAAGDALVIGVPGGRAWGVESDLRALPLPGTRLVVRVAVMDEAVREAFVRVAYYGSASGRSRQLATVDSALVGTGARETVALPIEPPPGAVAYRVRVLARLFEPAGRSSDAAVTARIRVARGAAWPLGSLASRLLD